MNNTIANIPVSSKEVKKLDATNKYSNNLKDKSNIDNNFKQVLEKASKHDNENVTKSNYEDANDVDKTKLNDSIAYSKTNENHESEVIEEGITISAGEKIEESYSENDLMLLLQQLLQGKISFEDFATKVAQDEGQLEELSMELTNVAFEGIKEKLNLSQSDLKTLEGRLSSDLTQMLKTMLLENGQEDKSFEVVISKMSEVISKALEEVEVNQPDPGKAPVISIQEQIINSIKNKLQGNNTDKQTSDLNNTLNNNTSENLQDSTINKLQNTNNNSKNSSKEGSNSSEDKFLKELANGNKSDITNKVDKLVNFMNGFTKEISTSNVNEVQQAITVNKDTFINDVIKSVKFMQQNDMKEMTVKLMPRELGEIVIKLTMENGLMKANITANNKEAYNLLNSNIQDLNKLVGNGEIKIQNVTIDIYQEDTTFFSRENSKEQNKQSGNRNGSKSGILRVDSEEDVINSSIVDESSVNAFV